MNNSNYGVNGCWWGLRLKPQAYYRYLSPAEPAGDTRAAYLYTSGQDTAVNNISTFTEGVAAALQLGFDVDQVRVREAEHRKVRIREGPVRPGRPV